jgi:starch synthase
VSKKKRLKILYVSSEVYPFAKSGGLADVGHGLPRAMAKKTDVSVILPLYAQVERERFGIEALGSPFKIEMGVQQYEVQLHACKMGKITYVFVESEPLSRREYLYGPPEMGYEDNALRFGLFCRAVLIWMKKSKEPFDILHLNDWQTALCALLVREDAGCDVKTVFTIHNLAYQGVFEKEALRQLGLSEAYFTMDALEYYGRINLLKAGIAFADAVTTVSRIYAEEILTPEFGFGLEGFLCAHRHKLSGILNGIDTDHFSPESDNVLWENYDENELAKKAENKKAYLKQVGLKGKKKPLFIFIGRLTAQKGVDILIEALDAAAELDWNIALLGEGEGLYHRKLETLASRHENIHLFFGYDEALSHRMYAAADFLLMPSHFEPCGLNQMIAMRYGAVPIVHSVGGLKESVQDIGDFNKKSAHGYGIRFDAPDTAALRAAFDDAVGLYADKKKFKKIIRHNMACDFSWKQSAASYLALYKRVMEH